MTDRDDKPAPQPAADTQQPCLDRDVKGLAKRRTPGTLQPRFAASPVDDDDDMFNDLPV